MKRSVVFLIALLAGAAALALTGCSIPNSVSLSASASGSTYLPTSQSTTLNVDSTSSNVVLTGDFTITNGGTLTVTVKDGNGNQVFSKTTPTLTSPINQSFSPVKGNWTLSTNATGAQGNYSLQLSF